MDVEVSFVVEAKLKDVGFVSIEVFADLLEEFVPKLQESPAIDGPAFGGALKIVLRRLPHNLACQNCNMEYFRFRRKRKRDLECEDGLEASVLLPVADNDVSYMESYL
nr:hypothetical protein [Tanacetum cinerariifolium]